MPHLSLLALLVLAFALLAGSSERHRPAMFKKNYRGMVMPLRICGWLMLILSFVYAVGSAGWALGLVAYLGHVSLAAGLIYCGLFIYERCTCSGFSIRKLTKSGARKEK